MNKILTSLFFTITVLCLTSHTVQAKDKMGKQCSQAVSSCWSNCNGAFPEASYKSLSCTFSCQHSGTLLCQNEKDADAVQARCALFCQQQSQYPDEIEACGKGCEVIASLLK